jgi:hypothetical protein
VFAAATVMVRALTTAAITLANAAKIVMVRTVPRHSRARRGHPCTRPFTRREATGNFPRKVGRTRGVPRPPRLSLRSSSSCRPERAVPKVRALGRSKRDSKSRSRRVRPRRGRAANRHLARGPEHYTGPQPVVPGSPLGSTPTETFVRVGPRVRIRFPPPASHVRT